MNAEEIKIGAAKITKNVKIINIVIFILNIINFYKELLIRVKNMKGLLKMGKCENEIFCQKLNKAKDILRRISEQLENVKWTNFYEEIQYFLNEGKIK